MTSISPLISVIVPLYNRLKFLPQLYKTLDEQTDGHFELVLVDDGSTDGTQEWVEAHSLSGGQKVTYLKQENAGPYSARNKGLSVAKGEYIAFQDSDDEWPNYHLEKLRDVLDNNQDIDWVFGSIQRIDHESREVVKESNYYIEDGVKHPFIALPTEIRDGEIHVVNDLSARAIAIEYGIPGSMQCGLIRSTVFEKLKFDPSYRTTYDRFFSLKCLLLGFKFAFVKRTHQIYHIHDAHISLAAGGDAKKREISAQTLIRGYSEIRPYLTRQDEKAALARKLAEIYAWVLSVALQDQHLFFIASKASWKAVVNHPTSFSYSKQLVKCLLLSLMPR